MWVKARLMSAVVRVMVSRGPMRIGRQLGSQLIGDLYTFWELMKTIFISSSALSLETLSNLLPISVRSNFLRGPHYGTKPGHFETSKIHFPTSEGVSEVSERANE